MSKDFLDIYNLEIFTRRVSGLPHHLLDDLDDEHLSTRCTDSPPSHHHSISDCSDHSPEHHSPLVLAVFVHDQTRDDPRKNSHDPVGRVEKCRISNAIAMSYHGPGVQVDMGCPECHGVDYLTRKCQIDRPILEPLHQIQRCLSQKSEIRILVYPQDELYN